jgi:hypothetical protein
MNVRILTPAIQDLVRSAEFYEKEEKGLGEFFLDNLFREVNSLEFYAGIHSLHFGFHRLLSKRFPYAIYYRMIAGEVVIFRVLDCRRDPRKHRSDLRKMG